MREFRNKADAREGREPDADFELFYKLSSLYNAMTFSVVAPVVVESGLAIKKKVSRNSSFGYIFYDCLDDEERGLEIVRGRKIAERDVQEHFILCEKINGVFYEIKDRANENNREEVTDLSRKLGEEVMKYAKLVLNHGETLGDEKAFLLYPVCVVGHYFFVKGYNVKREKKFNEEGSFQGLQEEVRDIFSVLDSFVSGKGEVARVEINDSDLEDRNSSLEQLLDINRGLWERIK
ncbi:hypothetical protein HYV50_02605 [Candidatus Pacearchaeota archaeon]|nr:hypothetical protein [Candidatus Pacearchaeota archaeon]